jgi:urocanate hydratase
LEELKGKVFVSSGLGGMSGAQGKAGVICGAISVIAEINEAALVKRHKQGWVMETISDLDACIARIKEARQKKETLSIGFLVRSRCLLGSNLCRETLSTYGKSLQRNQKC